ncbi:hypothetical protein HNW13_011300 [Shewanella sp. BF02_Schw]|uniref:hypothetical protein n=1 Tax=Shewanella sp. BF02_Schw TaxID=394908 RepID=UPI0017833BCD|nr:hypothetical protein [Shewanella sp. BF02_Schw]MBO1896355.1 hypothetical protein [Shewanella sp. BF02_Schw]
MKSTSSLWVGALWQAAMPVKHEIQSPNTSQTSAEPSSPVTQQTYKPTNPA